MERLERQLAESQRLADEHLSELTARKEHSLSVAASSRKEAKQAAAEMRKRQMIAARDQQYREAKLHKMQQLRDRAGMEQKLLDTGDREVSHSQKIEVRDAYFALKCLKKLKVFDTFQDPFSKYFMKFLIFVIKFLKTCTNTIKIWG